MAKYHYSQAKQKVLLLLAAGVVMGLSGSPRVHWKIIKNLPKAWKEIDRATLRRILREFKYDRLVDFRDEKDGSVSIVITEKGETLAMRYDPDKMQIAKAVRWDRKWRMVIFDIPEKRRAGRDALREKLKKLGFYEFQKSVWVFPYSCEREIKFLAEFFEVQQYIRILTVQDVSMDADLKLHFGLN